MQLREFVQILGLLVVNSRRDARLIEFLEAVYALERDDQNWLISVLEALSRVCGGERKYLGFFYDASNVDDLKVWNQCRLEQDVPPDMLWAWGTFLNIANAPFVRATLRSLLVGSARKTAFDYLRPLLEVRERHGHGDFFYVNALDPSGLGCVLTVGFRQQEFTPDARTAALFKRMATHLSAAYRCRRKLALARAGSLTLDSFEGRAEAILDSNGRFVHAEGPAQTRSSREQIRSMALAIESARTEAGRRRGCLAVEGWHPVTAARWTLIDNFQDGGRRYIVAYENQVNLQGFDILTDRERQIVVHAALGYTNKEIAYALGVSHATVRVLMARAAKRLGVNRREDLLAHPSLRELRPAVTAGES